MTALLPAVQRRTPERWSKHIWATEKKERNNQIRELLEHEISTAFETAKKQIDAMKVTVIFKGVTYELLNNDDFLNAAKKAIPATKKIHWEKRGVLSESLSEPSVHLS